MSAKGQADQERRDRIGAQADRIAELLGIDPDDVMFDAHGVSLSIGQADKLIACLEAVTK